MTKIILDEKKILEVADQLFDGATLAKKKVDPVSVLRNDGQKPVSFNVVLKDGTVENRNASIPSGGFAVVQAGGEINVMKDLAQLYEGLNKGVPEKLATHASASILKAGIADATVLTVLTAIPKQRIDKYLKLPNANNGESIDFVIMKPWGENGAMIEQNAKSGDVLVLNGTNKSSYFNSVNGTLGNFVNANTGRAIPEELAKMKTAPLETLVKAAEQGQLPDGQGQGGTQEVNSPDKGKNKQVG